MAVAAGARTNVLSRAASPVYRLQLADPSAGLPHMPITARLRTGASSAIMAPCLACRSKMCPSRLMLSCGNAQLPRTSPSRST